MSFKLKISFSIFSFRIIWKENDFPNHYCRTAKTLTQFFYLSLIFSLGRLIFCKFTDGSSYWGILRFERISKKIIKNWRHLSVVVYNLTILNKCVLYPFVWVAPLSEKNVFIVFQNNLLSVTFFWFNLLKYSTRNILIYRNFSVDFKQIYFHEINPLLPLKSFDS